MAERPNPRESLRPAGQTPTSELPPGIPTTLGPCRLVGTLGSGAMGIVCLAELVEARDYAPVGTRVAVKVLHPGRAVDSPQAIERFLRESDLGRSVVDPAVVRTYESDTTFEGSATHYYMVMEYVEGTTLRAQMAELAPMPEALLRHLAARVAAGLGAVHAAGAIHRDVKPSNVLLTPEHQVKLMDLGMSLLEDESARLTRTGHFVGTLLYCAPEQIRGERLGPTTDLYALGIVLYEAATAVHPFYAESPQAVVRRQLDHVPPKAGLLNPQLSPYFEELLAALLEKDPDERIVSAFELVAILEAGEASAWWKEREKEVRASSPRRELRRVRVPRETSLIGREVELLELRRLFTEAGQGQGRLVLLEGEAGVGKTRLLDELLRGIEVSGDDATVLYGSYPPGGTTGLPGGLAQAVVAHFGEDALESELKRLLARVPRLASPFASFLTGSASRSESSPDDEPSPASLTSDGLHAAFAELLRGLAKERTVVWVIDDLHFATADDKALLLSLARAAVERRALLLVTTRPGLSTPFVDSAQRLGAFRKIAIPRLSHTQVSDLLREAFASRTSAEEVAGRIAERSDGNPFFLFETLREMEERGVLRRRPDGAMVIEGDLAAVEVPSSVRELLLARLRDSAPNERAMLDVAAVQGFAFDPDLIASVLERRRLEVLQTLAEVERRSGVIRATGAGFRFDHHQLQEVVEDALPPLLREEYHRLLASAYETRSGLAGKDASEVPGEAAVFLTRHYLEGKAPERALRLLVRALERLAARHQSDALLNLVAAALPVIPAGERAIRTGVLLRQAETLRLLGRRVEERRAIEEATACAPDEWHAARARHALGRLALSLSDYAGARRALEEAVSRAHAAGDATTEARALGHLGVVYANLGQFERAREQHERSIALCQAADDRTGEARGENNLSTVSLELGRHWRASAHAARALELSRESGDALAEVRARINLGHVQLHVGQYEGARAELERAAERAREVGDRVREATAVASLGSVYHALGRCEEARSHFERMLARARETADRRSEVMLLASLGRLALDEGRLEDGERGLAIALALARMLASRPLEAAILLDLGHAARTRGQLARARDLYTASLDIARAIEAKAGISAATLALGRERVEAGRGDEAAALLEEAEGVAEPIPALVGTLPAAYLALAGKRDPASVEVAPTAPLGIRAEAHLVLHRAGGGPEHLVQARALLMRLASHLTAPASAFWKMNPVARQLRDEETAAPR